MNGDHPTTHPPHTHPSTEVPECPLSVQQDRAGSTVAAHGFLEPAVCDGTSHRFEVTLTGTGGKRFRQGAATWSASGYVEGDTGVQTVHVPPTPIVLTR
jgi:hypothetical protein